MLRSSAPVVQLLQFNKIVFILKKNNPDTLIQLIRMIQSFP